MAMLTFPIVGKDFFDVLQARGSHHIGSEGCCVRESCAVPAKVLPHSGESFLSVERFKYLGVFQNHAESIFEGNGRFHGKAPVALLNRLPRGLLLQENPRVTKGATAY